MKGVICRTEWPICLGLSLPGIPQGFPMVQGGVSRLQMWGRQTGSTWQCTGWGQPGAGRRCVMGLQVMCFSWLKSCISQLAWTCTKSLRNHLVLLRGTASRALHLAVLSQSGALSCFHLDVVLVLRSRGMAPEPAYGLWSLIVDSLQFPLAKFLRWLLGFEKQVPLIMGVRSFLLKFVTWLNPVDEVGLPLFHLCSWTGNVA